ncbi:MAG: M20/M25/M40 family metallo-hydrolase [Oscillospiraceae bacterium]|nr:M20/M25/M40 family metallo-hydrolase [Oscillospiraceae bacterium]
MNRRQSLEWISTLSDAYGPSGFEDEVLAAARRYMEDFCEIREDPIRNLYLEHRENNGRRPVVLLDGHADEVGFMVQLIRPNGTLQFVPLGGWVPYAIPAHKVRVRSADGSWISGVVACTPAHFLTAAEREKTPPISAMVIDVGARSLEEARDVFGIRVGAPVVPDVTFEYNEKAGVMLGKAFDCRLGCGCVADTLRELCGEELGVDLVGVLSSQEEMGTRGAQVAAQRIKPDLAIVFEGSPADDTFTPDYAIQTAIGKGPMLRHLDVGMITNPRFIRYVLDMGAGLGIPLQEAVRTGGRTNGAAFHLSESGTPTVVIGLPVRYIHSHHGFAHIEDYENAVRLACAVIRSLDEEIIAGF